MWVTAITRHKSPRCSTTVPTRNAAEVAARAVQLVARTDAGQRPVRLLGVSVHNFCDDSDGTGQSDRLPFGDERPGEGAKDTEDG